MNGNRRRAVRALMICHVDPWADTFGASMRLRLAHEALSALADVDVVVVSADPPTARTSIVDTGAGRMLRLAPPPTRLTAGRRLRWSVRPDVPIELLGRDHTALRRRLVAWLDGPYALVWVARSRTLAAVGTVLPAAPVVLDLDDLESIKLAARRNVVAQDGAAGGSVRRRLLAAQADHNIAAWRRFDRRQAERVDAAVVCSEADAEVLGASGDVHVVPNAYRIPDRPLGRPAAGRPPTVLLHGLMTYAPNADAARYFVGEVLPLLRRQVPDVAVRIVGRHDGTVEALHDPPHVIVTGFVDDIGTELAQADAVVVPIRFGGGTRIKILEAMAHRIPVVSTSIGAYGLGLGDGDQVLLRDDPADFADACRAVLVDDALRARLTESGRRHLDAGFTHDATVRRVQDIARQCAPGLQAAVSDTGQAAPA